MALMALMKELHVDKSKMVWTDPADVAENSNEPEEKIYRTRIRGLSSDKIESKQVWEGLVRLTELGRDNRLNLCWGQDT